MGHVERHYEISVPGENLASYRKGHGFTYSMSVPVIDGNCDKVFTALVVDMLHVLAHIGISVAKVPEVDQSVIVRVDRSAA